MTDPRGLDVARVNEWIAEHAPDIAAPARFTLIAAGGSNLTFRITDANGESWILRRPPVGMALATAHDMAREFRVMSALGAAGATPVPRCLALCDDTEVTGAPFYLMSFVDGPILSAADDTAAFSEDEANRATDALVYTQAGFHQVSLDEIGLADLGRHDDYVGRQLKRWRIQVERADVRPLPLMVELHERLVAAKPPERARPALVHGDYRFDNVVLTPDLHMAAVLDWELTTTGDPIADFVWSLQYWAEPADDLTMLTSPPTAHPQFPDRAEVARRYEHATGFDLSDLAYLTAFSWWKQACIVEGVYGRKLRGAGGGHDGAGAAAIAERSDRLFERAHELANEIESA